MSRQAYLEDSYLKEIKCIVTEVKDGRFVVLDNNIFYPVGGGQPDDKGQIISGGFLFNVISVKKSGGGVYVEVDNVGLSVGQNVFCKLDWSRRYKLMRMHTAAHLLSAIINSESGALITGNQLDIGKSRIDFSLDDFDRQKINYYFEKANKLIEEDRHVKVYVLPRDEALSIPSIVKLAGALPPDIPELRIVEIEGVDIQADGGTHVHSLSEIGNIQLVNFENKGSKNRRVYFSVDS